MVVTEQNDPAPLDAVSNMAADLAARIYERHGLVWPVSGDKTARTPAHRAARAGDRITAAIVRHAGQGTRRRVAGGWLIYCDCAAGVACMECGD